MSMNESDTQKSVRANALRLISAIEPGQGNDDEAGRIVEIIEHEYADVPWGAATAQTADRLARLFATAREKAQ
jgi:hypothetical protein